MVYKVRICTSSCPYCGETLSKEYYGPSVWGPKYGRCPKCKRIFRTGKRLYSDASLEDRMSDRKEFFQGIAITIPLFLISLIVTIITGWQIVGLLAFFSLLWAIIVCSVYFSKTKVVLSKYSHLKESDPELYQLEYEESMRLSEGQSIDDIEDQIRNNIEHKAFKFFLCFLPSVLLSELILMGIVGDAVEGGAAVALLLLVSIPIACMVYFFVGAIKKRR